MRRPESGDGAADKAVVRYRTEDSRVLTVGAVIAEHVDRGLRYDDVGKTAVVAIAHVRLVECAVIDVDATATISPR